MAAVGATGDAREIRTDARHERRKDGDKAKADGMSASGSWVRAVAAELVGASTGRGVTGDELVKAVSIMLAVAVAAAEGPLMAFLIWLPTMLAGLNPLVTDEVACRIESKSFFTSSRLASRNA